MIKWKYNENVEMDLPETTLEAFDKFTSDIVFKAFIPGDCIKTMRKKFKQDFNLKEGN